MQIYLTRAILQIANKSDYSNMIICLNKKIRMTLLILGVEGSGHHMFHTFQKAINHASTGILSKFNSFPQYQKIITSIPTSKSFSLIAKTYFGSNTFYSIRTKLFKNSSIYNSSFQQWRNI